MSSSKGLSNGRGKILNTLYDGGEAEWVSEAEIMETLENHDIARPGFMDMYSKGQIKTRSINGERDFKLVKPERNQDLEYGEEVVTGRTAKFDWQEYNGEKFPTIASPIAKDHFDAHELDEIESASEDGWRAVTALERLNNDYERRFYAVINDFEKEEDEFRAYMISKTPEWAEDPRDYVFPEKSRHRYIDEMASNRLDAFIDRTSEELGKRDPEDAEDFFLNLIDEY